MKSKIETIIVESVSFHFIEDNDGYFSLESDGVRVDSLEDFSVFNKIKDFLKSIQTEDDREYQYICNHRPEAL